MLPIGLHFLPIPRDFWSAYLGAPFQKCIDCEMLLSDAPVYVIQKRIVAGEAVFEMAICEKCRCGLTDAYSEETKAALNARMSEYFRIRNTEGASDSGPGSERESPTQQAPEGDDDVHLLPDQLLDRCMNYCLICDRARTLCHRYSLAGLFRESEIVVQTSFTGQSPVMVCDQCERSLTRLISQRTRDSWDRFVEEHFDGPPSVDVEDPSYNPISF